MIPPSLLANTWPAANRAALGLLPPLADDPDTSPVTTTGVAWTINSSAILNDADDTDVAAIWPPFDDLSDDEGVPELGWLAASPSALPSPLGVCPAYIDALFTGQPGVALAPASASRLWLVAFAFWNTGTVEGVTATWQQLGSFELVENARTRVRWVNLTTIAPVVAPDALAFLPLVPAD